MCAGILHLLGFDLPVNDEAVSAEPLAGEFDLSSDDACHTLR